MCKFFSLVLTKKESYWLSNSNSHEDIIDYYGLREKNVRGEIDLLRVELIPPSFKDNNIISDVSKWRFFISIDQDFFPEWYNREIDEERTREVLIHRFSTDLAWVKDAEAFFDEEFRCIISPRVTDKSASEDAVKFILSDFLGYNNVNIFWTAQSSSITDLWEEFKSICIEKRISNSESTDYYIRGMLLEKIQHTFNNIHLSRTDVRETIICWLMAAFEYSLHKIRNKCALIPPNAVIDSGYVITDYGKMSVFDYGYIIDYGKISVFDYCYIIASQFIQKRFGDGDEEVVEKYKQLLKNCFAMKISGTIDGRNINVVLCENPCTQ